MSAPSRREFLAGAAGAGLVVAFHLRARDAFASVPLASDEPIPADAFIPNAWLRITPDDVVTVVVGKTEMGQGVHTSLPMIVADELGADFSRIKVEMAGYDGVYATRGDFGQMVTGGSESVRESYWTLRKAAASARIRLVRAAAKQWGVDEARCSASGGMVRGPDGKRATFGELSQKAADDSKPCEPKTRPDSELTLIGTRAARTDIPSKIDGSAVFGIDVVRPGMKIAMIARAPSFGATVASFDAKKSLALPGVRAAFAVPSGVAVVADSTLAAMRGRKALDVKWSEGALATLDEKSLDAIYDAAAKKKGRNARCGGHAGRALARAAKRIDAVYEVPFLAHATMEPQNCTAWVDTKLGLCEVWGPIQDQTEALNAAHRASGVPKEAIKIHTTYLGGGFGRRLEWDYVEEAVHVARETSGTPVKVLWMRDEDLGHDFYRPRMRHVMEAGLDADGWPTAWRQKIVGPSIVARLVGSFAAALIVDPTSVDGAKQTPYAIPNLEVRYVHREVGVPVGPWRSVGNSHTAFAIECFLDEVAAAGGKDPVELRRRLLAGSPRHLGVLERAVKEAGWGTPLPAGRARGLAVHYCFGTYVAHVVEVSKSDDGIQVERVVSAIDCGKTVNPDTIEAQVQGAIVFGLSAALHGEITFAKGAAEQANFDGYPPLRMKEMPKIDVHIVESTEKHGGVGEPGVPPVAPAVVNAIAALTGTRVRRLPVDRAFSS